MKEHARAGGTISQSGLGGGGMAIQRHKGLAEDAYEAVFNKLMTLDIAPGARITVDGLVRELEVSHTPIREALGRLEGEGLVVKTHLVGYSAAPQITRRRFDELYDFRLLLEPEAARRAALRISEENMAKLRKTAASMGTLSNSRQRQSYSGFARLDAHFHDQIMEIAGNSLIRDTLAHLHTHFHIFRLMYHARITEEALGEHETLLTAFSAGDEVGAERAMRAHIERSRGRLLEAFA
jgi:DNA-binding GntR family transcriptional regulator